ncbi:MAG: DUF3419 family protein [Gemmatimonadales bacterium]|nr:MAG: DUF3419 family protein [Gemmatimonadales bacterium]
MSEVAGARIGTRARFGFVRYGSVWEDADILCEALAPMAAGGRLLSVASAGDNALALLTLDPAQVVAIDLSPAQLACVELRMAALGQLDEPALVGFLGLEAAPDRADTYAGLRSSLSSGARSFWDAHPGAIARGIIHSGKFERYLQAFRKYLLPVVHRRSRIEALRRDRPLEERRAFYDDEWDTRRWRTLFGVFFSRRVMGWMGRDPAFFAHVEGTVSERILARTRYALTELPARTNPYLAYILTGTYPPEARPRYLRPEHLDQVRDRLGRIELRQGSVEEAPGVFDGMNLSNIFEYMDSADHLGCYRALLERARPGTRLAYWNLLVPRTAPPSLEDRVRPLEELARELHARDQAWFYEAFHVDEVTSSAEKGTEAPE